MKTIFTWLLWLAVIVCVARYFLHQHQKQVKEQRAAEIQQQQNDASIAALAQKFNAITNWESSLPGRDEDGQPFSIDLSNSWIQSNRRPVLLTLNLVDIEEKNTNYSAIFRKDDVLNGVFRFSIRLECTHEQVRYLLKNCGTNDSKLYAVIARIDDVGRPRFRLSSNGEGEDASIAVDTSSSWFIAGGVCVDLLREEKTNE